MYKEETNHQGLFVREHHPANYYSIISIHLRSLGGVLITLPLLDLRSSSTSLCWRVPADDEPISSESDKGEERAFLSSITKFADGPV